MYKVQRILDKRPNPKKKGGFQYLVKWQGWDIKDSTWEPKKHLENVLDLIEQYQRQTQNANKRATEIQSLSSVLMISQKSVQSHKQSQSRIPRSTSKSTQNRLEDKGKNMNTESTLSNQKSKKSLNNKPNQPKKSKHDQRNNKYKNSPQTQQHGEQQQPKTASRTGKDSKQHRVNTQNTKKQSQKNKGQYRKQSKKSSINVLGMKKQANGFWYYITQKNGNQCWVMREFMIQNHADQLCQFYESRIVFNN